MSIVDIYWDNRINNRKINESDRLFANRCDWVIYRLCVERPMHSPFEAGANGGVAKLMEMLNKVTNSEDHELKISSVGMVSRFLSNCLMMAPEKRYVRLPQATRAEEVNVDDGDKITDDAISFITKWLELRVRKLRKQALLDPENINLMNCVGADDFCSVENAKIVEKRIILTLSDIAITQGKYYTNNILDVKELKKSITELQKVGGRWSGVRLPVQNLNHKRIINGESIVAPSCYLPVSHGAYDTWISTLLGHLASHMIEGVDINDRVLYGMMSLKHREATYRMTRDCMKQKSLDPLATALTRVFDILIDAKNLVGAAQLAARFLNIYNRLETINKKRQRISWASKFKSIALAMGHAINDEIRNSDLSAERDQTIYSIEQARDSVRFSIPTVNTDEFRNADIHTERDEQIDRVSNLLILAKKIGVCKIPQDSDQKFTISCLRSINKHARRNDPSAVLADLTVFDSAFRLSLEWKMAGNLVELYHLAKNKYPCHLSIFKRKDVVTDMAESLKYLLDRPYMEDAKARRIWQWTLWEIYQSLSQNDRENISINSKILIYSTVAHISSAAFRAMHETIRKSMENSPLQESIENSAEDGDYDSLDMPINFMSAVNRINVDERKLMELLSTYKNKVGESAIVQLVLSQDGRCMTIAVFALHSSMESVVHAESTVKLTTDEGDNSTWDDIAARSRARFFYYRNGIVAKSGANTVAGFPGVIALWREIKRVAVRLLTRLPSHLCLIPDARVANIPWQWVALHNKESGEILPLVSLIHGLRWAYIAACPMNLEHWLQPAAMKTHAGGVNAKWISNEAIPDSTRDCRALVRDAFSLTDRRGLSISIVFDHGIKHDKFVHAICNAVTPSDWMEVRKYRICVLLSCETGATQASGLGDAAGLSNYLCRHAKVVLAPSVEVPYTAAVVLAKAFKSNFELATGQVRHVYQSAIDKDPLVALFSLWGLPQEPLVWRSVES